MLMTLINLPQLYVLSHFFLKTYTCKPPGGVTARKLREGDLYSEIARERAVAVLHLNLDGDGALVFESAGTILIDRLQDAAATWLRSAEAFC